MRPTHLIFHRRPQTEPPVLGGRRMSPPASSAPRWSQATVLSGLDPAQATVGLDDDTHQPCRPGAHPGPPRFVASGASAPASPTVAGGRRAPRPQPVGPDGTWGADVRAQPRRWGKDAHWLCRVHPGDSRPPHPCPEPRRGLCRCALITRGRLSPNPPRRAQREQTPWQPSLPRVPPGPRPHLCGGCARLVSPESLLPALSPEATLSRDLCVCRPAQLTALGAAGPGAPGGISLFPLPGLAEETMSPECICMSIMLPLCTWEFSSREQ